MTTRLDDADKVVQVDVNNVKSSEQMLQQLLCRVIMTEVVIG